MSKSLNELFIRTNLSPTEVGLRIMDIVKINRPEIRKYVWKDPKGLASISYEGKASFEGRDNTLIRLRQKLIAVAIEVNRFFFVIGIRKGIIGLSSNNYHHHPHGRGGSYFCPKNALHPEEYRMEFLIEAFLKKDFRLSKEFQAITS